MINKETKTHNIKKEGYSKLFLITKNKSKNKNTKINVNDKKANNVMDLEENNNE